MMLVMEQKMTTLEGDMEIMWMNEDKTVLFVKTGDIDLVVEPNHPQWEDYSLRNDIIPYEAPPAPDPLLEERKKMVCTVRQARIVLGETVCNQLDAMSNDPEVPWALRQTLKHATVWERTLPEIDEIGWALGYTNEQIDDLFRQAMLL